jgi:putative two-component system response regulator
VLGIRRKQKACAAQLQVLDRIAVLVELPEDASGEHTLRVGQLAAALGAAAGLGPSQVELLQAAARLHDLGKVGVPRDLLLAPRRLSLEEFEVLQRHTIIGAELLSGSRDPILEAAAEIALSHHECWDGTGYPRGLAGEQIPLCGRIVNLVDFFDALTHDRTYRKAHPVEKAVAMLVDGRDKRFDPHLIDLFSELLGRPGWLESITGLAAPAVALTTEGAS